MSTMSSNLQASSSGIPTPNFQPIFENALKEYKKKTGKDLTTHPLTAEINGCDSPDAIITVLQGKAGKLAQRTDERLTGWLTPTVNVLNALSVTLGQGVGSVFPPTNIIFSGISILLVAARDTVASREALVELFDRIEAFFCRLRTHTEVPPTAAITDVMAKIMAEVLYMLAIATKHMSQGRTKTFLRKVAGMNDIEDALQRLDKLEQGELRTVITQVARDTSGLKDSVKRIEAVAQQTVTGLDASYWKQLLRDLRGWLSPPDPSTNHNIACGAQHERTSMWLFREKIFKEWELKGSLLWIHGKPGSGKSVLCSAIIQHIVSQHETVPASISYFYFDFKDTEKQHRRNLLRSLLIQLSAYSNPCCDFLYRVYSAHGKGTQQPSDDSLKKCLKDTLSTMTQHPNYIILDALDECPDTTGVPSVREEVLNLVNELVDLRLPNLHICATSRPEIDIRTVLEPSTSLRISLHDQPGQKEDIAEYIRCVVHSDIKMKRWREDDRKMVIEVLSEKADGMFRWVFCQLEMLRHCLAPSLRRQLNELPQSLDETYERILKEIHLTNQGNTRRLLHCVAVAKRPLRVEELAEVLAFDPDEGEEEMPTFHAEWRWEDQEQAVLSACSSLVSIVESKGSRVVQFSHFSVKEFLTSKRLAAAGAEVSQYHIHTEPAHAILTQACLGVLLSLDNRVDEQSAMNIPLAAYAAEHWVSHAQVDNVTTRVRHAMATLFDSEKPHFLAWLRIYCVDPPQRTRLMYVPPARVSLERPPTEKPQGRSRIEKIPRVYAKPLYYSALYGFYNLVEQLVIKDPHQVNAIGGAHGSPLLAALWGKHVQVAEFLLEHGANIDIQGPKNKTPLHKVITWSGDSGVDAMQFLLKHGADVNAKRDDLSTPLHRSASKGRFKAAQLLLEFNANVNAKDEDHGTPLHYASEHQRQDVAQILLEHGAKADAKNNKLLTPLHLLFPNQRWRRSCPIGFVELLLTNGAEVNARDENYETPLHLASKDGKHDIAQMLLDHGAEVNATNKRGETPLHRVLRRSSGFTQTLTGNDRLIVVQLLLDRGADVNLQDNDDITPLHLASEYGRLELARALLDCGAKIDAENNRGETPLHRLLRGTKSADSDFPRVARLLLERGADVNARDKDHGTPLHLASNGGSFDIAQVLVEYGSDVNAKDGQGQSPLFRVIEVSRSSGCGYVHLDVIGLLVGHGADANIRGEDNTTALHLASKYGRPEVTRVLLNHGASLNAKNNLGRTPFHELARAVNWAGSDHLAVAQLLLENNVDLNARDEDHETPLHLASKYGRLDVVLVLIDHSAIIDTENNWGQTPLHLSSQVIHYSGHHRARLQDIVRLLLERGANANARDKDNATPLHLASSRFGLPIASVLLDGGAHVNARDNRDQTPLHRLLTNGNCNEEDCLGAVRVLLKHGADVNAEDEGHATALHLTFDHHKLKVAPVLLDHGANPNAENNLGETPLHRLLKCDYFKEDHYLDTVQLLLERGTNPNARDKDDVSPLQLASRNGTVEVARLLRMYGAKDAGKD